MRGEAEIIVAGERLVLRPTFQALVAAEGELGPLFALLDRAGEGRLGIAEAVALLWHCADVPAALTRARFSDCLAEAGLAAIVPAVGAVLRQIMGGR